MKSTELRIGNYVMFSDSQTVFMVNEISETGLGVEDENESTWIELETFEPIPITEEWLLKFGFDKSQFGYFTKHAGSNVMSVYCFKDFSRIEIVVQSICNIKHVHQLQNLFFCLCGEELTLKS